MPAAVTVRAVIATSVDACAPARFGVDGAVVWQAPAATRAAAPAGLPGALATIAIAPPGAPWSPGPSFYMDKLVLGHRARGAASLGDPPEEIVEWPRGRLGGEMQARPAPQREEERTALLVTDSLLIADGTVHRIRQSTPTQE